ncbi:hypothetical protein F2P56_020874 [Juglans regia]|uniref:Retrotransposon Copia-like N-terminal domain-containing protein n=1 Tax=Juglans regia TaxID=51240 RepID=A0A833WQP4_JUGRE|nr:hypothetical protein F2P56_020874 [Juglans regia]
MTSDTEVPTPPPSPYANNPSSRFLNFSDPFNPFRIENGDNPAAALVSDLLTADNYVSWSRAISRALRAKNKLGFINGTLLKPADPSDPLFEAWERCNDLVVSWLQNFVSSSVKSSLALVDDSRILWIELKDRFTQQNGPRIFQLKRDLASLSQNQDSISIYFGRLKGLWDELAVYDPLPDCDCGKLKILHTRYDRDCVIQFLMGLSDSYSITRDQIMLLDPLPPLNHVFSMVQQQERHHQMISPSSPSDLMVMMAKSSYKFPKPIAKVTASGNPKPNRPYCSHCKIQGHSLDNCFKLGNAEPPLCTHCHMTGHNVDKCYKIHGYPSGHKLHGKSKIFSAAATQSCVPPEVDNEDASTETMALTKSQYNQLIALLHSQESNSTMASLSIAQPSSSSSPNNVSNSRVSVSYKVKLPNGETVPVTHVGIVQLSEHLDLASWTTIGMSEVRGGLYHLLRSWVSPSALVDAWPSFLSKDQSISASATHTASLSSLWHYRLGHISFSRLLLIKDPIVINNLHSHNQTPCSICPLAKQHRLPFPSSNHSSLHVFDIIHCDIWGPNSTIAVDGSRFFLTIVDDFSRTTWQPNILPPAHTPIPVTSLPETINPSSLTPSSTTTISSPSLPLTLPASSSSSPPAHLPPRRSTRTRSAPKYLQDYHCQQTTLTAPIPLLHKKLMPSSAIKDPGWCQAMDTELAALEDNQTWELTDLPPGKVPIDCRKIESTISSQRLHST